MPVEEVVLAVAAEDVAAVTAALELGATVNVGSKRSFGIRRGLTRRARGQGVPIP